MNDSPLRIRVAHSPDPDDAFMFYALAQGKIPTGRYRFEHQLTDIETLNHRALVGQLELTALSLHAYAHTSDLYLLCPCGASMGDGYGPVVAARQPLTLGQLADRVTAVPGRLTTAFLALSLCLGSRFSYVTVPFDEILEAVARGHYEDQPVDAGLIIHEGQLTYADAGLIKVLDTGQWWFDQTGLPLPLGANAIRGDLGEQTVREVTGLLRASIQYGLDHRDEALDYALSFGRGLDRSKTDQFVGMYVNQWTLDLGPRGREAVQQLLARGHAAGLIPKRIQPEFVELPD